MSGCLIDTNALSELRKEKRCDAGVRQWFDAAAEDELFISVPALGEIRQAIERIRPRAGSSVGAGKVAAPIKHGDPNGNRTRAAAVKGQCPNR